MKNCLILTVYKKSCNANESNGKNTKETVYLLCSDGVKEKKVGKNI